jgi:hypothetical protein
MEKICAVCKENNLIIHTISTMFNIAHDISKLIVEYTTQCLHLNRLDLNSSYNDNICVILEVSNKLKYATYNKNSSVINFHNSKITNKYKCIKKYNNVIYKYDDFTFDLEDDDFLNVCILHILPITFHNSKSICAILFYGNLKNSEDVFHYVIALFNVNTRKYIIKIIVSNNDKITLPDDYYYNSYYPHSDDFVDNHEIKMWFLNNNLFAYTCCDEKKLIIYDINTCNIVKIIETGYIMALEVIEDNKLLILSSLTLFNSNCDLYWQITNNDNGHGHISIYNLDKMTYESNIYLENLKEHELKIVVMDNKKIVYTCYGNENFKSYVVVCNMIDKNKCVLTYNKNYLRDIIKISNTCVLISYDNGCIQMWDVYSNKMITQNNMCVSLSNMVKLTNNMICGRSTSSDTDEYILWKLDNKKGVLKMHCIRRLIKDVKNYYTKQMSNCLVSVYSGINSKKKEIYILN